MCVCVKCWICEYMHVQYDFLGIVHHMQLFTVYLKDTLLPCVRLVKSKTEINRAEVFVARSSGSECVKICFVSLFTLIQLYSYILHSYG